MRISIAKVKAARKLLASIQKKLKDTPKNDNYLTLDHYQNWREQGFIISNLKRNVNGEYPWVGFSENRNSDDIVVYPSQKRDFVPNQGMSDAAWKNAKYFRYDAYDEAANFCIKHLLG